MWERGTFIAVPIDGNHSIALYHMGEFWAEVWYDAEANNIALVRGFKSRALLDLYADMVDISQILD